MPEIPPCCVPSLIRLDRMHQLRLASAVRIFQNSGSTEDMVRMDGGRFLMGSEAPEAIAIDGEGPVVEVSLDPFYISKYPVTNEQFAEFIAQTNYRTEAERAGWSFVFHNRVRKSARRRVAEGTPWWVSVKGANWSHPEGRDSSIDRRLHHPVVHISSNDADAYCQWAGVRKPTEAEWEYAARGGLVQNTYAWSNDLTPGGIHMCNIWQGVFPEKDLADDGHSAPAPVDSFAPNGYGLYTMIGNTWEWCGDWFHTRWRCDASPLNPTGPATGEAKVMKGGSYICHSTYCFRYRNSARTGNVPGTTSDNLGFRTVRDL